MGYDSESIRGKANDNEPRKFFEDKSLSDEHVETMFPDNHRSTNAMRAHEGLGVAIKSNDTPNVLDRFRVQQNVIDSLENQMEQLLRMIEPILKPSFPTESGDRDVVGAGRDQSPIADEIDRHTLQLELLRDKVARFIDRVEV